MNDAPGPINFTMFLTLFGERLQGTDPEDVIKNAFGCFDENNEGVINEERLRELLVTMGDRFTDEDVCIFAKYVDISYLLCIIFINNNKKKFIVVLNFLTFLKIYFHFIHFFQVDEMYREAPISKGMFNYIEFTRILKHGAKEKDEV